MSLTAVGAHFSMGLNAGNMIPKLGAALVTTLAINALSKRLLTDFFLSIFGFF